jgi:hypothetical protein
MSKRRKFVVWFFSLWAIYWVYEFIIRNIGPEVNIRIDLLLLLPALGLVSLYFIYGMIKA